MMEKLRRLFISSFRWRLLINIIISYIVTFLIYSAMIMILESFDIFSLSIEIKYFISFVLSLCVFLVIFFDLMNITLKYLGNLSEAIQEVTNGDYNIEVPIEYDDELGLLAANINALAKTLADKEIEGAILKENERLAFDAERNAEKQKNDLITNVAHDLRTPLTTIVGYLELIKNNDQLDKEDIKKYSTVAYEKSKRLQSMMDDLFEFTSLDQANVKVHMTTINISELILQIVDEFYPTFQEHNLKPTLHVSQPNLLIHGDGQLLARVFDNLLSNAVKYGEDNNDIKIEVLNDEQTVTIKIMNYGNPIAKEDLPYIFDNIQYAIYLYDCFMYIKHIHCLVCCLSFVAIVSLKDKVILNTMLHSCIPATFSSNIYY